MSEPPKQTVAVIGLGAMGIVTVKNLVEEGFDVTGFDRSSYVGGLWHFNGDPDTLSVLQSTVVNVSIDKASYTDFPYPEGTPIHCTAKQVEDYIHAYANHFSLHPRFRLETTIRQVSRDDSAQKWKLDIEGKSPEYFDKVVMATGPHVKPTIPIFSGSDQFAGEIIHSKAFKRPDAYAGKRTIVVGIGNTGGDIVDALVGHASSVSLSHNQGAFVVPRLVDGEPLLRSFSYRFFLIQGFLETWLPSLAERITNSKLRKVMDTAFGPVDPAWSLQPCPSIKIKSPVISDTLVSHLRSGAVTSIPGIRRIVGIDEVELSDGTLAKADAIICCTGYQNNFSMLEPRFDPSANPSQAWLNAPGSKNRPFPRLFRNLFSLQAPESLAFLGCIWVPMGAFCLADISSMCIAQVWSGKSQLPSAAEMKNAADRQEKRIVDLAQHGTIQLGSVPQGEWLAWADAVAGLGVRESLGWGWKGWKFWWRERRLWKLLMDGVWSSAAWRLFEGEKRKAWAGAREQVERWNRDGGKNKDV